MSTLPTSSAALEEALAKVRRAPADRGRIEMIVAHPAVAEREVLARAWLDTERGLEGDRWALGSEPEPERMVTLINSRAIELIAGDRSRWPLAGDQLFVDFDLSHVNCAAGTRIAIGDAIVEVTDAPHLGCRKFMDRFGREATLLVNSDAGKALNLRGINARVVRSGSIGQGDELRMQVLEP